MEVCSNVEQHFFLVHRSKYKKIFRAQNMEKTLWFTMTFIRNARIIFQIFLRCVQKKPSISQSTMNFVFEPNFPKENFCEFSPQLLNQKTEKNFHQLCLLKCWTKKKMD